MEKAKVDSAHKLVQSHLMSLLHQGPSFRPAARSAVKKKILVDDSVGSCGRQFVHGGACCGLQLIVN